MPDLYIGVTREIFKISGIIPVLIDSYILVNTGEIIGAIFFIIVLGVSNDTLCERERLHFEFLSRAKSQRFTVKCYSVFYVNIIV